MVLKEHSEDEGVNWMENGVCQSDLGGSTYGLSNECTCRMDQKMVRGHQQDKCSKYHDIDT